MRLLAPAKLNLHLRVGPPRADGFHPLLSWMCTIGLFDTLKFEYADVNASTDPPMMVGLTCDRPDLPSDERNLVVRVTSSWGRQIEQTSSRRVRPLSVTLNKVIPAGAGLGGGSSDGSRALLAVNELWQSAASTGELAAFSAQFGSDLPFFFHGPSSICRGRGEIVGPIATPAPKWALLVLPEITMPTPQVYRRFDQMQLGLERDIEHDPDWPTWSRLDANSLLANLVNDLEPAAFDLNPALGDLREALERHLHRIIRMSGSGSSLFTLFDGETDARSAVKQVLADFQLRCEAVELAPRIVDELGNRP